MEEFIDCFTNVDNSIYSWILKTSISHYISVVTYSKTFLVSLLLIENSTKLYCLLVGDPEN